MVILMVWHKTQLHLPKYNILIDYFCSLKTLFTRFFPLVVKTTRKCSEPALWNSYETFGNRLSALKRVPCTLTYIFRIVSLACKILFQ